jgi:hypothetical protein
MRKKKESPRPMPQIIAQVPQRGATGKRWAANLDEQLTTILMPTFSPEDGICFLEWQAGVPGPESMLTKLDEVILRQAETTGWRLALASIVQKRFSDWDVEEGGPQRFARLGKAYRRAARIMQGLELPPLDDPQLYLTKVECVAELKTLQRKLRQKFAKKRGSALDLRKFFLDTVADQKQNFVSLKRNVERWAAFFERKENLPLLSTFAQSDRVQRTTAVYLFDAWMAWCKGAARGKPMDQETVRKKISEAGKSLRS